jgi:NADP-dependent 3-hydroxy acid dehydrogenase YdfG
MTTEKKVWFITGCSSGFGHLLAQEAARRGDFVVATARNPASLTDLVDAHTDNILPLALDVTNPDMVKAAIKTAEKHFGHIDIVVNNAGYALVGGMEEVQPDEYRALFETNFFGAVSVTQAALPGMRARRRGHVINISSMGGISGGLGMAYYGATKFALTAISESLSQEAAPLGIKVTVIEPGGHRTNAIISPTFARTSIPDYAATIGRHRELMATRHNADITDPINVVRAILAVADSPAPPLHLPVGADALARLNRKLDLVTGDRDRWMDLIVQS